MTSALRRDVIAGGTAGLIGGLIFGLAMEAQTMMAAVTGLVGLPSRGAGLVLHLGLSILLGAGFGAVIRYQPKAHASTLSAGLLFGLLWWLLGPLTLVPLVLGHELTWSLSEAASGFTSLVGHLLYGGATGIGFHLLAAFRRPKTPAPLPGPASTGEPKREVLILGGGFGGIRAAQRLEELFGRDPALEITLVSQSNFLLFTPMLAEVASSALEAQHIAAPARAALSRTRFRRAEVETIDTTLQEVKIRTSRAAELKTLLYDHLILALGSVPNFHGLPGLEDSAFTLKTLDDATRLRNHVIALLELADEEPDPAERRRQLTFVVAGGGFAGTEMIAELFDLVHSVLRLYPNIPAQELRFVLIHSRDRILPEISADLAEYALQKLQERGIEFRLNTRVSAATPLGLSLDDGTEIASRTLVWTAGNQPHPLLETLPCNRNRAGAVIADGELRVEDLERVWAVGDCAEIPNPYDDGNPYPPTAQHALRQGMVVAENIAAALRGTRPKPFRFRTVGTLVALGHRTAVAELRGWKFSGLLAWFMWRMIYLSKLPGLEKKIRVALDWLIDLFFPRDIVQTSLPATPSLREISASPAPSRRPPQEEGGLADEGSP